jgi:histidine ammonia-lyase
VIAHSASEASSAAIASYRFALRGHGVTVADVAAVARRGVRVDLAREARDRIVAAREVVDRVARSGSPVYGLTTALGANTGAPIAPVDLAAYQRRAVQARAVAVGAPFATDVTRAMLFARLCGMAAGGSGVSQAVFDALLALLNARVHPVVPSKGSIGAADLAPLAHLALPLLGEGYAEFDGTVLTGSEALARAGLSPALLEAKDGLALISSNAATVGHAALVLVDCARTLDGLNLSAALTFEGFRAHVSPLDERVNAARGSPGQALIAQRMRELLTGSALLEPGAARRIQDPISLRCVTPVHGAAFTALAHARDSVERELNGATESPLVLVESGEMLSNGNFHTAELALAFETLGLGLAQVALLCVERCQRLYSPALSGLPLQLTRRGPEHSGFATIQKTLTALYNELRHLAQSSMLDCLPVSEAVEDHASMAPYVVAKTAAMLPLLGHLAAIELLSAAQAIDLRELDPRALGSGTGATYEQVRRVAAFVDVDRPLGYDIEALSTALGNDEWPRVDLLHRSLSTAALLPEASR